MRETYLNLRNTFIVFNHASNAMFVIIAGLRQVLKERVSAALVLLTTKPLPGLRRNLGSLLKNCVNTVTGEQEYIPELRELLVLVAYLQLINGGFSSIEA